VSGYQGESQSARRAAQGQRAAGHMPKSPEPVLDAHLRIRRDSIWAEIAMDAAPSQTVWHLSGCQRNTQPGTRRAAGRLWFWHVWGFPTGAGWARLRGSPSAVISECIRASPWQIGGKSLSGHVVTSQARLPGTIPPRLRIWGGNAGSVVPAVLSGGKGISQQVSDSPLWGVGNETGAAVAYGCTRPAFASRCANPNTPQEASREPVTGEKS